MKKNIVAGHALERSAFLLAVALISAGISGCKKDPPMNYPPVEKKVVVTTVAGGRAGFEDGPALSAKFNLPADVAVAPDGTIYVTDLINSRIRKISGGQVSTFAGSTTTLNIVDGNGQSAHFKDPRAITIEANGNLYTSDGSDPRIRKISLAADVSTYAGTATSGFNDGRTNEAQFMENSWGMVTDPQGNLFVADAGNNRIRKISISGEVSTVAGSGVAGFKDGDKDEAQFKGAGGLAIDKQGNLYVADRFNSRIRKITRSGQVSTFAGSGIKGEADGNSNEAQFYELYDLVIDSNGNLYATDNYRIRKITPQGFVSTIAGSIPGNEDGPGASAKFSLPVGLGIDLQDNIYVTDILNYSIRKISFE